MRLRRVVEDAAVAIWTLGSPMRRRRSRCQLPEFIARGVVVNYARLVVGGSVVGVAARSGTELGSRASSPWPGGEPGAVAVDRALPALLERTGGPGPVLVVGHQTLFRLLLCRLLDVPLDRYRRAFPRLDNVARTVLSVEPDGRAGLLALNLPTSGAR